MPIHTREESSPDKDECRVDNNNNNKVLFKVDIN